jgi:hypothetical protein
MADLSTAEPQQESVLTILKALSEISALFLAVAFVGGWSYLSSYYRTFGVDSLDLEFSSSVVSTVALFVLCKELWPLILFALAAAILAVVAHRQHRLQRGWVAASLCLLMLVVIIAAAEHGRSVADLDMLAEGSSLPNVTFAAKNNVNDLPCVEVGTFGTYDCKLLLHSKTAYYFFLPIPAAGAGNLNLYVLPDAQVVGVHELRGLDRNAR